MELKTQEHREALEKQERSQMDKDKGQWQSQSCPGPAEGPGLARAGHWALGCCGAPIRGRVRPGWGRLGLQGHQARC